MTTNLADLQRVAESGDRDAQLELGIRLLFGIGMSENHSAAVRWLNLASERGSAEAVACLGWCHEHACGVPQDTSKALASYEAAAAAGSPRGHFYLALTQLRNDEHSPSFEVGLDHLSQAAAAGLPDAAHLLGSLYAAGQGVKKDIAQALKWWTCAAEAGVTEAMSCLGAELAKSAETRSDAYMWYVLAARYGDRDASSELGKLERLMSDVEVRRASTAANERLPEA